MKVQTLPAGTTIKVNGIPYVLQTDAVVQGGTDLSWTLGPEGIRNIEQWDDPSADVAQQVIDGRRELLAAMYNSNIEGYT